jgi:hypothetical protein
MMNDKDKQCCGNCRLWADYKIRVFAKISEFETDRSRNTVELRLCKYIPAPQVVDIEPIYTDENYCCSEFEKAVAARR